MSNLSKNLYKLVLPIGHKDSKPILSLSGGKDSTGAALAMRENGIEFEGVFADTGWEAPETYEYVDMLERKLGLKLARVAAPGGMVAKIRERAGFPARKQRWCTRELKVFLIRALHDQVIDEEGVDTISVTGIRAEESEERAQMPVFAYDELWKGYVWRPMRDATVHDILHLHHRHGIPVNPLYKRGHNRVGCYPCIYATKEEIALVAEYAPWRIDEIDLLEQECELLRVIRNAETPDRYSHSEATFFQARIADHYETKRLWIVPKPGAKRKKGKLSKVQGPPPDGANPEGTWRDVRVPVYKSMHIRDVVAWTKTSRGGRQLKVIQEAPSGGCFRWGLCEPPDEKMTPP